MRSALKRPCGSESLHICSSIPDPPLQTHQESWEKREGEGEGEREAKEGERERVSE